RRVLPLVRHPLPVFIGAGVPYRIDQRARRLGQRTVLAGNRRVVPQPEARHVEIPGGAPGAEWGASRALVEGVRLAHIHVDVAAAGATASVPVGFRLAHIKEWALMIGGILAELRGRFPEIGS